MYLHKLYIYDACGTRVYDPLFLSHSLSRASLPSLPPPPLASQCCGAHGSLENGGGEGRGKGGCGGCGHAPSATPYICPFIWHVFKLQSQTALARTGESRPRCVCSRLYHLSQVGHVQMLLFSAHLAIPILNASSGIKWVVVIRIQRTGSTSMGEFVWKLAKYLPNATSCGFGDCRCQSQQGARNV